MNSSKINVFANKAVLVNSIPPPLDTCINKCSPAIGDGAASVNEDIKTVQWKNLDKMYPLCSREISIICQASIMNIILIQGIAPLQQISGKLQNI
jgi:hypothetical protein